MPLILVGAAFQHKKIGCATLLIASASHRAAPLLPDAIEILKMVLHHPMPTILVDQLGFSKRESFCIPFTPASKGRKGAASPSGP